MKNVVLEVIRLSKEFGKTLAVDDVSFDIKKGEIVGLLGPNGAGKTTTLMMLLGITKPTTGRIKMFGLDFSLQRQAEIKNRVNFSSAYTSLLYRLTVQENLYVFARLYNVPQPKEKIKKILNDFELGELKNELTGNLSSGQSTRLNLAKAFLNDPEILFLDEPTASLDPEVAKKVREILFKTRRERNTSMLYTSHNMEEIALMCDRVIFLNRGKIAAIDTPLNLTKMVQDSFLTLTFQASLLKVKKLCEEKDLDCQIPQPNVLELKLKEEQIGPTLTWLAKNGVEICDIAIEKPDLEDVFLKIASRKYELRKD